MTIYDEDGLRLTATTPFATPAEAFTEARKIVDNKIEQLSDVRVRSAHPRIADIPLPARRTAEMTIGSHKS